ncbi:feline leukemia virus subgroup C receptor-related protein 2 [Trichogramma pretiosum]|uniref:feline leukemia virus subgroup C receptor-related protein 2 n=1 Tax=Trichogramma pretiosum TaxID=7493 RepID=UPI0006C9D7DB|nr:feline leukemia virus subgroup C receptor-related protein 2 [Trichogramma pretiosum]XP_014220221.1 feline leukemia virus subgroup C receptor-related protein 2 [Trichogramma pretiosum]XP_014220222.1 feline leukemia virus subgroup C receptor-related protein 2 [Trichogramma pretiosum]XP_014220223.1 feline leukemia virus subgroup C receptor-related protein 2 [Trichogramma pretiosum]XP_014220224.1 feline leukemia virus subgroup C receptor-related protein 2 [Trichogramma pretiosum]XP_023317709.1 
MSKRASNYVKAVEGGPPPTHQVIESKIYKRRWVVLGIFVLYSACNAMQWIQYSIITDIVKQYYDVGEFAVYMTSMIYMITYVPFIFPASYFLDKFGLRYSTILGAVGTAIGSWIKCFSVSPDLFWLTFTGQTIVAVSQTFILSVPARLAAVWFGPDQVSSACSIGVFGNQLGVAIGFLFPPMMVPGTPDTPKSTIGQGLSLMFYLVAGASSVILILILLFFKDQPPLPPSPAQAVQKEVEASEHFMSSLKRLFTNYGYLILLVSYAINVGIFYALSTLLSTLVTTHYENASIDAGRIGLSIVCSGMVGSVVCGIILDKTHRFKETTLGVYIFSFIGMVIFTFTLDVGKIYVVYITASILGFFMTGYLPVGFEFAAELTYPEPEGTSAGLLNAMVQIFGVAFISLYTELIEVWGDQWANIVLCVILFGGTILAYIIPNDLRRQNAKF